MLATFDVQAAVTLIGAVTAAIVSIITALKAHRTDEKVTDIQRGMFDRGYDVHPPRRQ